MTTVAMVGTGRMGSGMAHALAAAGHRVVLQNRTRGRAEALAAEIDATVVATPAEAAATADVTITMLADDDAVAAVYTGRDGLVEGARAGTVLVDSSTVRPDTIRAVEAPVRATGAGLPAALVERVEVAALVILVGRPAAGGDRPIDVLDADLEPVDDVGDVIEERPVRPTGVRGGRAGQSPGGIVEPGPHRREAVPYSRFVRPEITLRGSEVDRLDIGERRSAEIDVRDRCDGGELPIGAHRETMRSPLPSTVSRPTLASSWSPSSTVRR